MADNEITQENDPGRWQGLFKQWRQEGEPGWVVTGNMTFRVVKRPNAVIVFIPENSERFYESTSFLQ